MKTMTLLVADCSKGERNGLQGDLMRLNSVATAKIKKARALIEKAKG